MCTTWCCTNPRCDLIRFLCWWIWARSDRFVSGHQFCQCLPVLCCGVFKPWIRVKQRSETGHAHPLGWALDEAGGLLDHKERRSDQPKQNKNNSMDFLVKSFSHLFLKPSVPQLKILAGWDDSAWSHQWTQTLVAWPETSNESPWLMSFLGQMSIEYIECGQWLVSTPM